MSKLQERLVLWLGVIVCMMQAIDTAYILGENIVNGGIIDVILLFIMLLFWSAGAILCAFEALPE